MVCVVARLTPRQASQYAVLGITLFAVVGSFFTTMFLIRRDSKEGYSTVPFQLSEGFGGVGEKSVAVCILTRRNGWDRRHLVRQTWLQDVPPGGSVGHVFVIGEDKSFSVEENRRLIEEVKRYGDILIAPAEESYGTLSLKTKHCIYWATQSHDFDILIKTDDDSTLFLSRMMNGWLKDVDRNDFVYFGKQHLPTKVANPTNFELTEHVNTDKYFEFDYRGLYWPEFMQGGMYGFSRRLAEEIVRNDFWTYTSEDATVGVWMSALRPDVKYLAPEQLLYYEYDYQASNGTDVIVTFQTDRARLASMWCEYEWDGKLSPKAIQASDAERVLGCLRNYEKSQRAPASRPLGSSKALVETTVEHLSREWPIVEQPDLATTGEWWSRMAQAFRLKTVYVIGTSASINRLPLYLLHGKQSLVFDSFFRLKERFAAWSPTMYMCIDPELCASPGDAALEANRFIRALFASFFLFSPGPGWGGAEYWRYMRQRVNVHWFLSGGTFSDRSGMVAHGLMASTNGRPSDVDNGGGRERREIAGESLGSGWKEGEATTAVEAEPVSEAFLDHHNFQVSSRESGLAMSIEILAYLGFSPIYLVGVEDEILHDQKGREVMEAVQLAASVYNSDVKYLYADDSVKLPPEMVSYKSSSTKKGRRAGPGTVYSQEEFMKNARRGNRPRTMLSDNWDIELFLLNFPAMGKVNIVHDAPTIDDVFPNTPRCREGFELDRFEHAILCSLHISLRYFDSFLVTHVPHGPVRDTYMWVKRR